MRDLRGSGPSEVLVHYIGWPEAWDEWVRVDRLAPLRSMTEADGSSIGPDGPQTKIVEAMVAAALDLGTAPVAKPEVRKRPEVRSRRRVTDLADEPVQPQRAELPASGFFSGDAEKDRGWDSRADVRAAWSAGGRHGRRRRMVRG